MFRVWIFPIKWMLQCRAIEVKEWDYNQEQKGWEEFTITMFPYARDTNTVRANDKCPFPDPYPLLQC